MLRSMHRAAVARHDMAWKLKVALSKLHLFVRIVEDDKDEKDLCVLCTSHGCLHSAPITETSAVRYNQQQLTRVSKQTAAAATSAQLAPRLHHVWRHRLQQLHQHTHD